MSRTCVRALNSNVYTCWCQLRLHRAVRTFTIQSISSVCVQAQCRPRPRYLQMVQDHELVDAELRAITVSWMIDAHRMYELEHESTLHLAVTYLDRYLSKIQLHPDHAQLLAVVALNLAMKVVESKEVPVAHMLANAGDEDVLTVDNVEIAEVALVEALDFRLSVPTAKVRHAAVA